MAVDGLGGFISNIFGSKNKSKATAPEVDPKAYQYGGTPGGANEAAGRYRTTAEQAQSRQGAQAAYGYANEDRAQGKQARQGQQQVADMTLARAMGGTPSIAGMQAQQDMRRAQSAQAAQAASARGPAALAMAQQNAANNTANAFGQISGQAQVNAANERMQAEQSAAGMFGQMRGGDLASQGQVAQQAQFDAGLGQQQRGLNDAMTLGMTANEMGVRGQQLGAAQNMQAQQSANQLGAAGINAGVGGQNAAMNQSNAMGLLGMGQSAAGAAFGGGKAEGGPVQKNVAYVMGERGKEALATPAGTQMVGQQGPEIVVPQQDGVVVPNHALPARTWGTGPIDPAAARGYPGLQAAGEALQRQEERNRQDMQQPAGGGYGGNMAIAGISPGLLNSDGKYQMKRDANGVVTSAAEPLARQDEDLVAQARAKQAEGIELTEEEERKLGGAESRIATGKKNERKGKATLASRLAKSGEAMQQQAAMVDVGYHGPSGGYMAPQLIPIGARAFGGPVTAGQPYMMGEMGPEALVPTSGPGAPGSLASVMGPAAPPTLAAPGPDTTGTEGGLKSYKELAGDRVAAAGMLTGMSRAQVEAAQNPNGKINGRMR